MADQDNNPPRKHKLDYFDVFAKAALSLAVIVVSCQGMYWNRDANTRGQEQAQRQINNQIESLKLQDAISQRQLASSMMPYITCRNPSSGMALELIHSGAPAYETMARTAMLSCAHTPAEKAALAKLQQHAQEHASQTAFLQHLNFARQYIHVNSYENAAAEYLAAYQELPADVAKHIETQVSKAKQAYSDRNFQEAAQLLSSAFSKIPASEATGS